MRRYCPISVDRHCLVHCIRPATRCGCDSDHLDFRFEVMTSHTLRLIKDEAVAEVFLIREELLRARDTPITCLYPPTAVGS